MCRLVAFAEPSVGKGSAGACYLASPCITAERSRTRSMCPCWLVKAEAQLAWHWQRGMPSVSALSWQKGQRQCQLWDLLGTNITQITAMLTQISFPICL